MLNGADINICQVNVSTQKNLNPIAACLCRSLLDFPCTIFIVIFNPVHLFRDAVVPGSSSPHLNPENTQLFSRWFSCVTEYGIILPHLAGGTRLQMPLWMIVAILKGWWQVSTDEGFCIELINPVCFHSSHH